MPMQPLSPRDIEGYEGLYKVDGRGQVWSCKTGRTLTPKKRGKYLSVSLRKEGSRKNFSIHRLVAKAFIPNDGNLPEVNHKDEDKHNNRADNLEWCSKSYNQSYSKSVKTYFVKDPEGLSRFVTNVRDFCRRYPVNRSAFSRASNAPVNTRNGWRIVLCL